MNNENQNWLHDLFINEAKAAKDYHNRGGEEIPTQEKTVDITENGTVVVEPDEGYTMSKVTANVDIPDTPTQEKTIDITENGTVIVEPDEGHALSKVTANVDIPETPTQEKTVEVTENGTIEVIPDEGHALSKVTANVNVPKEGVDKIQRYIELNGNSAYKLFQDFQGTSVDELMEGIDTSNVTDATGMFSSCKNLTSVPLFDTSSCTSMATMFQYCSNLTSLPLFDTSSVIDMRLMLSGCSKLTDIPLFNTSKVTDMSGMITNCKLITTIPSFDTSNAANMNSLVSYCNELISIPLLDTRNVTTMSYMFNNSGKVTTVPPLDTRNVTNMSSMFSGCKALTECWIRNIKAPLQVGSGTSWGHLLTLESLLHLCKECRNTGASLTLTVGSANLEKLANVYVKLIDVTDEMRAEDDLIDEKSPFVQCESTDEGAMLVSDYMTTKMWQLA